MPERLMGLTLSSGRVEDLDTPEAHLKFIGSQWRDFAAFAFQRYLSEGRGAVVIDLRNASKTGQNLQIRTYYVADAGERLAKLGGWPSDEIKEVIADYDPEMDIVFIFLRLNGDVFHYNVNDEPTPLKAYEARRMTAS
jgi:hypothetical protein